jgi:hypothetical protein
MLVQAKHGLAVPISLEPAIRAPDSILRGLILSLLDD